MQSLVIASNRGPLSAAAANGHPGAGGLLTGLTRSLRNEAGTWVSIVGGATDARRGDRLAESNVRLDRVPLPADEYDAYYSGLSNTLLWPLHVGLPRFVEQIALAEAWQAYRAVNARIGARCGVWSAPGGQVLMQDYHLSLAPEMLRATRPDLAIGHFTHCPWAEPADFAMLPEPIARDVIDGLLGANLLGFYARRWVDDFLQTCSDAGYTVDRHVGRVQARDGRWVHVHAYPLGVDPVELRREARCGEAVRHRRALEGLAAGRRLIVRVERMDPVKNLLLGLRALADFLETHRWAHNRVVNFVLACASRSEIPAYRRYRADVAARVRDINRRFGGATWQPVVLVEEQDYFLGLAALAMADIVVINSIRDGLNIVAKEAAAINDRDAVLILSRTAGAADDMADGALMIDPMCTSDLTDAIGAALDMPLAERQQRAASLRRGAVAFPPRAWLAAQRQDLEHVAKEAAQP